jgi:hypothetical protein
MQYSTPLDRSRSLMPFSVASSYVDVGIAGNICGVGAPTQRNRLV